ncbi:hypothetical protein D3C81_1138780 [compost metagenome]
MVGFANQLHIAIFDAVMHHFHVMSGSVRTNICTARIAVHFCGNCRQNRFNQLISGFLATRHDGWSFQGAFFTARYPCTDKAESFSFQFFAAALRIREVCVTPIDDNVPLIQVWQQLFDRAVCGRTGLYHDKNFARRFQRVHELFDGKRADQVLAFGFVIEQVMRFFRGAVKYRHGKAPAFNIKG